MAKLSSNQQIVADDIQRYKLNKLASSLALLAIVFNALYFCLLYSFTTSNFFSTWEIGISVIMTLVTLLITFLASEGIKNYNKKYAIVLIVLAVVQIVRMFGLPLEALNYDLGVKETIAQGGSGILALTGNYFFTEIESEAAYVFLIIWLALSAASLVASAVIGYINSVRLENYNKKLESGEINIEATLKELDEEDIRQAENVASEVNVTESELKLIEEDENA